MNQNWQKQVIITLLFSSGNQQILKELFYKMYGYTCNLTYYKENGMKS